MPRSLRHHDSQPPEDAWSASDVADDGNELDDHVQLSNILRTAEASRLRRRGAMRHALPHRAISVIEAISAPSISDHEREPLGTGAAHRRRSNRHTRSSTLPKGMADEGHFSLFCGAPSTAPLYEHDNTPFQPSPFPTFASEPTTSRPPQRTNGCGALLHLRGSPRNDQGVWLAKGSATDSVVGMDSQYFDRPAIAKAVHSSCGCIREGIGCSLCGNPLGTRYKPCQSAGNSILSSRKPSGSSSPQATPAASHPHPAYIYTFFSTAVSSYPKHTFTSRTPSMGTPSPVPIISRPSSSPPDTDVYTADAPVFDRFITASPQPVSEPDETTHEEEETRFAYWRDTIASYPFVMDDGDTPTGPGSASRQLTLRPDQIFIPHEAFDPDGEFLDMDPLDPSVLPDSQEKAFEPALFP